MRRLIFLAVPIFLSAVSCGGGVASGGERLWFIAVCTLFFCVIILMLALYKKERTAVKRLTELVYERTAELNEKAEMLEYMSMTDQLTDIPNKRCFDSRLDLVWRIAVRETKPVSLLMMDIDKFKAYNDMYGHQQGDALLREAAKVIEAEIKRPGDLAARWGGEEFAALLFNTDVEGALAVAESIRASVENMEVPTAAGDLTKVTISVGVCSITPTPESSLGSFVTAADNALHQARGTRNTVFVSQ